MIKIYNHTTYSYLILAAIALAGTSHGQSIVKDLDPLVVTGTRSERLLSEVPVRTEIVGQKKIETVAAQTVADAVEWAPGVRVENDCQNCNFQQVRLLGLQGNFTQILNDGRPTLSSLSSVYGIEQIPSVLIKQIEIVKGGGSALYGPGAIAGVINIIPRYPTENGGYVDYNYSTFGNKPNHLGGFGLDVVNDDLTQGFTFFGQYFSRSPYDHNNDGYTEVSEQESWAGGFRGFLEPTSDTRLTMDFMFITEERRGGDLLHLPVTQANIAEWIDSKMYQGGIRWEQDINDRFSYELSLSANYTKRDTYYGAGMDPNAFGESKSPLYQADLLTHFELNESLKLSLGTQYQYEKLEDLQPAYSRFTNETIENFGILTQAEWDPNSKWNIVAGARIDWNSKLNDPVVSPRLAIKHDLCEDFTIRGSYSSGFRAPQIFDEDLHITQAGGEAQVIRNAANLVEEKSQSLALGFEWNPQLNGKNVPAWLVTESDKPFSIEFNGFFTTLDNTFDIVNTDNPATPETEFTRVNSFGAEVYGAELNLAWNITNDLRFDLGYVEQRSRFDQPAGDFNSRNFDRTPDRYGVVAFTWNASWCKIFLGGKYTGSMEVPHYAGDITTDRLENSPSFFTVDLNVSKDFKIGDSELTVTAGVKNLFNDYQDDLDTGPDRDAGYVYGPRFPRRFHIGCKYRF